MFHNITMKLRKSLVKPVTQQKTYKNLLDSSARDHRARRI